MASFPNDTAENVRTVTNVMASFVVGDDDKRSWASVERIMAEPHGVYRLLQGFIALTGLLLQEMEFRVDPPVSPEAMLQKIVDETYQYPDEG
ncbi:hypothetical protein [Mycolicibacterium sp. 624]|uniref:hypothetical protein n=1 Tax=Mycolicibacterium sp. 624 TaxID=3156314 RepID=UPI0033963AD9